MNTTLNEMLPSLPDGLLPSEDPFNPETIVKSDWAIGVVWALLAKVISISGLTLQKASHNMRARSANDEGVDRGEPDEQFASPGGGDNQLSQPLAGRERRADTVRICCCNIPRHKLFFALGFLLYIGCQPLNVLALTFAPISLIAPLGSLEVMLNMVMSSFFLKEVFGRSDVCATLVCAMSSVGVVVFGPHVESPKEFPAETILEFWKDPWCFAFVVISFAVFVASLVIVLRCCDDRVTDSDSDASDDERVDVDVPSPQGAVELGSAEPNEAHHAPMRTTSNISLERLTVAAESAARRVRTGRCSGPEAFAYPMVVSVLASWSQLFAKALGMEIRNGVQHGHITSFVIAVALLAVMGLTSLAFITRAVSVLDNRFFVPAFFAGGTILCEVQGIIFFKEMAGLPVVRIVMFAVMCFGCIMSVCLINSSTTPRGEELTPRRHTQQE